MKKIIVFALTASFAAILSCLPIMAQSQVTFNMSTSFYAGNAKMPPGTYTLRPSSDEGVQILQNKAGTHTVLLDSRASSKTSSSGKPELLFNKYGNTDYLEGVTASNGNSVDFAPTTAEKIAAKKDTAKPHTVASQ